MDERTILDGALERLDPRDRSAYLDEACGSDEALRDRVEFLLLLHDGSGGLPERPSAESVSISPDFTNVSGVFPTSSDTLSDLTLEFLGPGAPPDALGMLGQYEVRQVIGRGAMGMVLKALDTKLNRIVAVKVLAPELAANPTARKRFLREGQAAAAVVHPNVVTIHAVGEERLPYLVMECVDGVSLDEKIDRDGSFPVDRILRIGSQIADGLAAAHKQGLIHRDIKPANILLENGVERVKITDFGLARAVDDVSVTRDGEVSGTPPFMSPEQAEGKRIDQRTDLFSLGSVLYTICTGREPFRADTTAATMRRICDGTPCPIREINPDVPRRLVNVVDKLLNKAPDDRYRTAQEVSDDLCRLLADLRNPAVGDSKDDRLPRSPGRRRLRVGAGVLLVLAAVLVLTETIGLTHLKATVNRLAGGEGTLVRDPGPTPGVPVGPRQASDAVVETPSNPPRDSFARSLISPDYEWTEPEDLTPITEGLTGVGYPHLVDRGRMLLFGGRATPDSPDDL